MSNCWINEPDTTCTEHGRHISNCSNIHASEVDKLKARLWKIVAAFKRGTPASHIFCECKKCAALYEAVREVNVYDGHGSSKSEIA